jgi:hypothetical protein
MMLELATSFWERCISFLMVTLSCGVSVSEDALSTYRVYKCGDNHTNGGNAYLSPLERHQQYKSGDYTHHDQNAMKNPRYEKKNTLPYLFTGLKIGIDFAFLLIGLISGALHSCLSSNPMAWISKQVQHSSRPSMYVCMYLTRRMQTRRYETKKYQGRFPGCM